MPEVKIELSAWQIKNLSVPLLEKINNQVQKFYQDPENEEKFKNWYENTYGKPVPQGV